MRRTYIILQMHHAHVVPNGCDGLTSTIDDDDDDDYGDDVDGVDDGDIRSPQDATLTD